LVRRVRQLTPGTYAPETISFQVVSEDLQSPPLQGTVILDFQGFSVPNPKFLGPMLSIPPGHLNSPGAPPREPPKDIELQFPIGIDPGCHSVTLVVTHEFKFDATPSGVTIKAKTDGDVATATWIYDLLDPNDMQPHNCGPGGVPTGDGGPDATAVGP
jgi:hypothetical protein